MKTVLACLCALVLLLAGAGSAHAQKSGSGAQPAPDVPAKSWAIADLKSGKYLGGGDADQRRPIASTTKIMAAIVAIENSKPGEQAVVSSNAARYATPIYSNVGLYAGDRLSVNELLEAALISSGDDAAYALAEHVGGGSVDRFVAMMNQKAKSLGLKDTHYSNPIGLDSKGNYSSAHDLAVMTRVAFKYPEFRQIVSSSQATITTQDRRIPLVNTNLLLSDYPPATGVKTGTTPGSGPCLVASAASGDESYVAVILDDADRFSSSEKLLNYAFDHYDRKKLVVKGDRYAQADVPYRDRTIGLVASKSIEDLVEPGSRVKRKVELIKNMPGSASPGTKLGTVILSVDGERVGKSPLVVQRGYKRAPVWQRVWYTVEDLFQ